MVRLLTVEASRLAKCWFPALALVIAVATSAPAAETTKFGAWSYSWHNSSIPLMLRAPSGVGGGPQLDVRQARQYAGFCNTNGPAGHGTESYCANLISLVTPFASANRGHLYVLGDEPDFYGVSPSDYAAWYRLFTSSILAVDPTARFSPGGFVEPPSGGGLFFTTYAEQFYQAYVGAYGVAPPVNEYRFNIGGSPNWIPLINQAVAWSQGKGKQTTLSVYMDRPATTDVRPELQSLLDFVNANSGVAHLDYFAYDNFTAIPHPLTYPSTETLTPVGQLYQQYAMGAPAVAGRSTSPLVDFNGDGLADFADQWINTGHFWIHYALGNGVFDAAFQHQGDATPPASGFHQLTGKFVGDAGGDYADVHVTSRQVWLHARNANGSFVAAPSHSGYSSLSSGVAVDLSPASNVEIVAGDFNGDGWTDLAKRELATGLLWVYLNNAGLGTFSLLSTGRPVARTHIGPDWGIIIGDFTGDGLADYADQHIPSGVFFIHRNTGGSQLAMDSSIWRVVQPSAGPSWKTIVADFTGDGFCDYADFYLGAEGYLYIHKNLNYQPNSASLPNGGFQAAPQYWGFADASGPGSAWQLLGSRSSPY